MTKAKLEPLNGKYYGTMVSLFIGDRRIGGFTIWTNGGEKWEPSDRELALDDLSREDWDNNIMVDDGWGGQAPIRSTFDGTHTETQFDYELAQFIVESINSGVKFTPDFDIEERN